MQRSISRSHCGKLLAGGAALLALQSAWDYRAAGQSLRNDPKDISGELSFDDAVLQAAAGDFGHVVHKKPAAMLRPSDAQDIATLVQFANRQGLKIAMRGQGHSFFGQTQVADGVLIDSRSLNAVRIVKSGAGGTAEMRRLEVAPCPHGRERPETDRASDRRHIPVRRRNDQHRRIRRYHLQPWSSGRPRAGA